MKRKILYLIVFMTIMVGANAQELANFMGREPIVSPEFGEETITFRISAPEAKLVRFYGSWMADRSSSVDMEEGENGVWSVSVATPEPEIYTYNFIVDGLTVNDANNVMMQRDGTRYMSVLMVPGDVTENYYEANERGNLAKVWYDSPTIGMERRMFVYTPYGYETSDKEYPVLYLLHGGGGDEDAWSTMGRARQILDNLIEKGLAVPMICVMPNGNPGQQAAPTLMLEEKTFDRADPQFQNLYVKSIVNDIIPFVEENYRAIPDRSARAVAGLSMGGGHTTAVTVNFPGTFDYILPLSAGMRGEPDVLDPQLKGIKDAGYKLYWVGCGEDDFLAYESSVNLDEALTRNGMEHTFFVTPGGHTWANWRVYLNTFGKLLFK